MTVAFLGLGAMGSRMVGRLRAAGLSVTTWTRSGAGSLEETVGSASTVISMLRDDEASRDVWGRVLPRLLPGALAIECSTLSVGRIEAWAADVRGRGGVPVEAPVVGSRPQAEAGALTALVGGAAADLERARPVVSAFAASLQHVGPIGHGARTKLLVNAFFATQVAGLGELLSLAAQSGLGEATLANVLATLPVLSPAARGALEAMVARRFEPQFPVALVEKDLGYVSRLGERHPVVDVVHGRYREALAAGLGERNLTSLVTLP